MKRLIVVLAVAVAVLVAVLWWRSRTGSAGGDEVADNRPMPTPKLVQGGGNPNDLPARMPVGARDLPPPPADFNPGQPETPPPNRTEKLRQGEFPLLPPRFDDAAKRAQVRACWERAYGGTTGASSDVGVPTLLHAPISSATSAGNSSPAGPRSAWPPLPWASSANGLSSMLMSTIVAPRAAASRAT